MSAFDHVVDAANDYAFVKRVAADDEQRSGLYFRRRIAATLWIPAVMVAIVAGQYWAESWQLTVALAALVSAGALILALGVPFRRKS
jgi:hypothetical protein